eukprot:TRINITY_DN8937_c0_g1_i1.p1 TRINITY_DN8937_c0_g1~~TRINITY_DN8937_c0_g1_i1.p1  ORF type:complete len:494 (+),score=114.70 TRINITY_DN8937_c0_g1_i1:49-1530(+)
MAGLGAGWVRLVVLGGILVCAVEGGNFSLTVTDDTRRVMDLGVFGFAKGGVMEFTVEYLRMQKEDDEMLSEPLGFTLDWVTTAQFARQEKNYGKGEEAQRKICFIEDPIVRPKEPHPTWRTNFGLQTEVSEKRAKNLKFFHRVEEPGLYALFFYNCKGYSDKTTKLQFRPVSFTVHVSQYNIRPGKRIDYLSEGSSRLPIMYTGFAVIFFALCVAWIRTMRANPTHVHKIHYLMAMLVVLKTCTMFFEAMKLRSQQTYGVSTGWNIMYYVFLTLKGITLFLVILLLGTGWSFLKPFLSTNDKHIALAILPLQIMINVAIAVIEETSEGNRSWAYWRDLLRVLDIVCCCVVLLPIVWSMKRLRSIGQIEGKVARNLARLKQFRTFYIFVVGFIYFTRIFVVLMESSLPFRHTWVAPFVQETAAVLFYLFTGMKFRPLEDNPYLYLETDDLDDADLQEEMKSTATQRPEGEAGAVAQDIKSVKRGQDQLPGERAV